MKLLGKLYLIPTTMGESDPMDVLPQTIKRSIDFIDYYIVENEKTARKAIKAISPEKKQSELILFTLNKHTETSEHLDFIKPLIEGKNIGLMSEAGCPGVADPGAAIVKLAHEKGIQVVPLVGPSSILLAMMASGMNGQRFAFNGYLPIDKDEKKSALKHFEKLSQDKNQSQIFIETPYRNNKLIEDILQIVNPATYLCIATDITLPTEFIKTMRVADWKNSKSICTIDQRFLSFIKCNFDIFTLPFFLILVFLSNFWPKYNKKITPNIKFIKTSYHYYARILFYLTNIV